MRNKKQRILTKLFIAALTIITLNFYYIR